jgi:uncharacterized OB-fold protein
MSNLSNRTARQGVFPALVRETYADETTQPFWDAALEDRLVMPKCTNCGTFRFPPKPFCFKCQHREVEWVDLPGTGAVYTFTVVRHPLAAELAAVVPYAAGVIEVDGTQGAGARMIANIIDCDVDALRVGDPVEIVWEHLDDDMSVFRFRPTSKT